jgi:hypothetical protein
VVGPVIVGCRLTGVKVDTIGNNSAAKTTNRNRTTSQRRPRSAGGTRAIS